jgi:hypothetical protein
MLFSFCRRGFFSVAGCTLVRLRLPTTLHDSSQFMERMGDSCTGFGAVGCACTARGCGVSVITRAIGAVLVGLKLELRTGVETNAVNAIGTSNNSNKKRI